MNILYIHQFFAGPSAPGPAQPRDLVQELAARGHHIDIVACDFNAYNEQTEPAEAFTLPSGGTIHVHRIKTPRKLRKSLTNRLRSYGVFALKAYLFAKQLPRPDVVFSTIQPLFSGYAGLKLATRWKRPFMLEIRDLWPDALVVKKAISPFQALPLQAMARKLYFGADRLAILTPGIKTEIQNKGVPNNRIDLLPNGFKQLAFDIPETARNETRTKYNWNDQFVAIYTGVHIEVTAIETIVKAAEALHDRPDIRIDLFGSGQSKQGCVELAKSLGLTNIHFHDPVPKSEVPAIIAGADAGIMTLFNSPLIHIYFENKLIDYMGSKKPIVAAMGGVQAEIIKRENAGIVAPGLDADGLADAIRTMADNPNQAATMGNNGYNFISTNLRQETILKRYAITLEALANGTIHELPTWDPFGR